VNATSIACTPPCRDGGTLPFRDIGIREAVVVTAGQGLAGYTRRPDVAAVDVASVACGAASKSASPRVGRTDFSATANVRAR